MSEATMEGRIGAARALIYERKADYEHEQLEAAVFLLENSDNVDDCTDAARFLVNSHASDYQQERMKAAAYLFKDEEDE